MKKILLIALLGILALGFIGCGDDGEDGRPNIKFGFDGSLLSLSTNIPKLPDTIVESVYYETRAGTWQIEYIHVDNPGIKWTASLTLKKGGDGDDGGLFSDGDDGDDIYYVLTLYSHIGPQLNGEYTVPVKERAEEAMTTQYHQELIRNGWIITLDVEKETI